MIAQKKWLAVVAIALFLPVATPAATERLSLEVQETYRDISATLGFVPTFLKEYPRSGVTGAWQELKQIDMNPNAALSPRSRELVALAVSAQIPCRYCTIFHTELSKVIGVTKEERLEALAVASLVRHWSTYLNGMRIDKEQFMRETDAMIAHARAGGSQNLATQRFGLKEVSVLEDIRATLGIVPSFLDAFPRQALEGAWLEMKGIYFNPRTAISAKDKDLIGLGVGAQVPCGYCTYFHTEGAKLNNANEREISEAVVVAALVRHWSTFLNGIQQPEREFKAEVRRIVAHVKASGEPRRY